MAVTPDDDEAVEPLGCGRNAVEVWELAADGALSERDLQCPHCAAAAADARGLDAVVHRMAAEPLEPPPSVLDAVMGAVVAELHPRDVLELTSPHGRVGLGRAAAAAVLRHVVDGMEGVRARSCRVEQDPAPAGADPGPVTVTISVVARFGMDLPSTTSRVRRMVRAAGEQALGAPVRRVDIRVDDVAEQGGLR